MSFNTIGDFVDTLVNHPDEAFIHDNKHDAFVFDTERGYILHLQGNFDGLREEIAWELRNCIREQHPLKEG
jgi:hypothetical protein